MTTKYLQMVLNKHIELNGYTEVKVDVPDVYTLVATDNIQARGDAFVIVILDTQLEHSKKAEPR